MVSSQVIERHLFLMFVEILVMSLLFLFCIGRRPHKIYIPVENNGIATHRIKSPALAITAPPKKPQQKHVVKTVRSTPSWAPHSTTTTTTKDEGSAPVHVSPSGRRRNRSVDDDSCTPVKASATNTGGGMLCFFYIYNHLQR